MRRFTFASLSALAIALPIACTDSSDTNGPPTPDAGGALDSATGPDTQAPPPPIDAGPDTSTGGDTGTDAPAITCPTPTGAGTQHTLEITQPETWKAADSPHIVPNDLNVLAKVTVEPCATIQLGAKSTFSVGTGGLFDAEGTASQPIQIGPKTAGSNWSTIRVIGGGTARFAYATIDGGGDPLNGIPDVTAAMTISDDQTLTPRETLHVDHVTLSGSLTNGIFLSGSGGFSKTSTALTIKGSTNRPIYSWGNVAGTIPTGTYTGNGKDQIMLAGLGGGTASFWVDTTLADRGVPYYVGTTQDAGDLRVVTIPAQTNTPLLTIAPGVTMLFKAGGRLGVSTAYTTDPANGALAAVGTAAKPIVFSSGAATPAAGDWLGIWFAGAPDPRSKMDFTQVKYAGMTSTSGSDSCAYPAILNNDAAIRFLGGIPGTQVVTNSAISDSAAHGIDRGYRNDVKAPDFTLTNTFTNLASGHCSQTYPRDISGTCPGTVPCP